MVTGQAGRQLIKSYEKLRLKAYYPTRNDVPTIGYGHTLGVYMGMVITEDQAEDLLTQDLQEVERCINRSVKVELTQDEFDALACFVFNVGCTNFRSSTLLRLLNEGDKSAAATQLLKWDKQAGNVLAGLTRRRQEERELFLGVA